MLPAHSMQKVSGTHCWLFLFLCARTVIPTPPTGCLVTAAAKGAGISFGCVLARPFLAFHVILKASAGSLVLGFDCFKQSPFMGREQPALLVTAAVKLT